jgi:carboxypeptidase PM20D1
VALLYIQIPFARIWLFGFLLKRWLAPNPEMNAGICMTTALTIINGGVEDNTMPAETRVVGNFCLLPGNTIAEVLRHTRKVIKDKRVKIKPVEGRYFEALPTSPTKSSANKSLRTLIRQVFDNPPVATYVMLGGTDCQHFVSVLERSRERVLFDVF